MNGYLGKTPGYVPNANLRTGMSLERKNNQKVFKIE
jgi:hypothetical protein